MRTHKEAGGY